MSETVGASMTSSYKASGLEFVHDLADKPTRFRFKKHRPREQEPDSDSSHKKRTKRNETDSHTSSGQRHRRNSQSRHRRRDIAADLEKEKEKEKRPQTPDLDLDPDTAFRESLFDAMADDEGALYWEGVYGQPVHIYSKNKPVDPNDPGGELEQMSDEEYTAYVRRRMWEKSHQHILEERRLREEYAQRRRESRQRTEQMEREKQAYDKKMEDSLRRGADRKNAKARRDAWTCYVQGWEDLLQRSKSQPETDEFASHKLPWPVQSGKRKDVDKAQVEDFFKHATPDMGTESQLRAVLKVERIRWHPDRMSHLLHGTVDADTLRSITEVFQIVDSMWANTSRQ